MTSTILISTAWNILWSVLILFTLQSTNFTALLRISLYLPSSVQRTNVITALHSNYQRFQHQTTKVFIIQDHAVLPRSSARFIMIAISYLFSGISAKVLYGAADIGTDPTLSWIGVIGYSIAVSIISSIIVCMVAPYIRHWMEITTTSTARSRKRGTMTHIDISSNKQVYSYIDFVRIRYGPIMKWYCTIMNIMSILLSLVTELTIISYMYPLFANRQKRMSIASSGFMWPISIASLVSIVTMSYTLHRISSLNSSSSSSSYNTIMSYPSYYCEKVQGFGILLLSLILFYGALTLSSRDMSKVEEGMRFLSNHHNTSDTVIVTAIFTISTISRSMLDGNTWLRISAANTAQDLRIGCTLGSIGIFVLLILFGLSGVLAYAKDPTSYDTFEKIGFASFLDLVLTRSRYLEMILFTISIITALCVSSVDRLQCALSSCAPSSTWVRYTFVLVVNIFAIYLSTKQYDLIHLLLVFDLIHVTLVFPVMLGFINQNIVFLSAPTELGALLGCISGLITVCIKGIAYQDGFFQYYWSQTGEHSAYCSKNTLHSFIIVPIISALATMIFSTLDIRIRGEKAKHSATILVAFDN